MKKILSAIILISFALALPSCAFRREKYDYSWVDDNMYIAHACGEVDNVASTNSREALQTNYDKGCRVFEVDMIDTSDGTLVCWHGWTDDIAVELSPDEYAGRVLTEAEFAEMPIAGQFHTMTFEYLANFMAEHDDIYVVTDTKSPDEERTRRRFEMLVNTANEVDPAVLERIIPQIYNMEMLDIIHEYYDWKSIIFTLYLIPDGLYFGDIVDFAEERGIRVITTSEERINDWFIEHLTAAHIYIYMHTFNDPAEVLRWQTKGVRGFYTDTLMGRT